MPQCNDWLCVAKDWQSLIAGLFQLFAAGVAYRAVMAQIAAQRTEHLDVIQQEKSLRDEHRRAAEKAVQTSLTQLKDDLETCRAKLNSLDITSPPDRLKFQLLLCKAPTVSALALAGTQTPLLENPLTLTAVHVLTDRLAAFNGLVDLLAASPTMTLASAVTGDLPDWQDALLTSLDQARLAATRVPT
jgi:hypothetical protein